MTMLSLAQPLSNHVACVGSRETPKPILDWMETTAADLVRRGFNIVTGGAKGADQAWARGGSSVDPHAVMICLPWASYETDAIVKGNVVLPLDALDRSEYDRYMAIAAEHHPAWANLSSGAKRLHARNVMIVDPCIAVVGSLNPRKVGGGGTGMAFKLAVVYNRPCWNVAEPESRDNVVAGLERRRLEEKAAS